MVNLETCQYCLILAYDATATLDVCLMLGVNNQTNSPLSRMHQFLAAALVLLSCLNLVQCRLLEFYRVIFFSPFLSIQFFIPTFLLSSIPVCCNVWHERTKLGCYPSAEERRRENSKFHIPRLWIFHLNLHSSSERRPCRECVVDSGMRANFIDKFTSSLASLVVCNFFIHLLDGNRLFRSLAASNGGRE